MITLTTFKGGLEFRQILIDQVPDFISADELTWINCAGLSNQDIEKILKDAKEIPDFLLEDCTTKQRPKIQDYEDCTSIIFKIMVNKTKPLRSAQLNLIFGEKYVLSIIKDEVEMMKTIQSNISKNINKINKLGVGHLVYLFLDSIVDSYYPIIEKIDVEIERMEGEIIKNISPKTAHRIILMKKDVMRIRRNIVPEKEILRALSRDKFDFVKEDVMLYFRDTYTDLLSLGDSIDSQREMLSGLMEIYLSTMSNNLNNVMKKLTLVTSLILVPSFIAGIYGMNIALPLEDRPDAFYFIFVIILVAVLATVWVFRKREWL
ncbi:MAG: magnesium/cobalt transporter CorA [Candidatus Aenigmarchaeota archaeon]|nr:magnesium/cobalt transporter CorA [Candidatus Aenigmarchaeota archaeon]